jgi:hypothetical protein
MVVGVREMRHPSERFEELKQAASKRSLPNENDDDLDVSLRPDFVRSALGVEKQYMSALIEIKVRPKSSPRSAFAPADADQVLRAFFLQCCVTQVSPVVFVPGASVCSKFTIACAALAHTSNGGSVRLRVHSTLRTDARSG